MGKKFFLWITFIFLFVIFASSNFLVKIPPEIPKIIFLGLPEFEYLQFKKAAQLAEVNAFRIEAADLNSNKISRGDILFMYSMGQLFSKSEEAQIVKAKRSGVKIINIYPAHGYNLTNISPWAYRRIIAYYDYGGLENYVGLLKYVKNSLCGVKTEVPAPVKMPAQGLFAKGQGRYFRNYQDYLEFIAREYPDKINNPRVALVTTNIGPKNYFNKKTLDYIIGKLEENNLLVFPIMGASRQERTELLKSIKPDIAICSAHGRIFDSEEIFSSIDSPVLLSVNILEPYSSWLNSTRGMGSPLMAQSLVIPEIDGAIEPLATAVLSPISRKGGGEEDTLALMPIEERVGKLVKRVSRWLALRKKNNQDKKVAIIYYAGQGRSETNISGLDLVPSLLNLLRELKNNGYNTGELPHNKEELQNLIQKEGIIYGEWASGAFHKFLQQSKSYIKVSRKDYRDWAEKNLSETLRAQLAHRKNDGHEIAIPVLSFENIVILPQPAVSSTSKAGIILHNIEGAPPDPYIATYLWIKEGFGADAVIHFGTHGTLEFIAGKEVFLSENDWTDALIGDLPNGYVYIVDDVAEALIAKRRALAVILSHLSPPLVESDLYSGFRNLSNDIHTYFITDSEALKDGYLKRITQELLSLGLDKILSLNGLKERAISEEELNALHDRIHYLSRELIPIGLHIYGTLPPEDRLADTIFAMLGGHFQQHLKKIIKLHTDGRKKLTCQIDAEISSLGKGMITDLLRGKTPKDALLKYSARPHNELLVDLKKAGLFIKNFRDSQREIGACIRFLDGKYILPSTGGDPIFNPASLPTGRNLYGVNPETIPTPAAWEAGKKAGDKLLEKYFKDEKRLPHKVAFTLWGANTVMDQGITEAQILWLVGVRPVYNQANNVDEVELIPLKELGRPRIDVVIQVSGEYRDIFGSRLKLLDKAIRLAAQDRSPGFQNFIRQNAEFIEDELIKKGISAGKAKDLSLQRIFGPKAGSYGIGTRNLFKNTSAWENKAEIAQAHISSMSGLYSSASWGEPNGEVFRAALKDTDIVIQTRSIKRTGGPLSLDHTYEYAGGLSLAIGSISGKDPKNYFLDNRNTAEPEILTLKDAIINEAITRLWNPKFIQGLMENDASGAIELKDYIGNLLGWQITKPQDIPEELWQETFEVYFNDKYKINLDKFLAEKGPFAYEDIAGIMLEVIRKSYWYPDAAVKERIMKTYINLAADNGLSCSMRTCGNNKLNQFVKNYFSHYKDTSMYSTFKKYLTQLGAASGGKQLKADSDYDRDKEISLEKINIIKKNARQQ